MEIDPWASKGIKNYDEICEKFGLEKIADAFQKRTAKLFSNSNN